MRTRSSRMQSAWCQSAFNSIIETEFIRKPSHPSLRSPVPELPEVETVVRELRPQLVDRRLRGLRVSRFPLRREWSKAWAKLLHGRKVSAVRRRGKWIILDLHEGDHLVLKASGRYARSFICCGNVGKHDLNFMEALFGVAYRSGPPRHHYGPF